VARDYLSYKDADTNRWVAMLLEHIDQQQATIQILMAEISSLQAKVSDDQIILDCRKETIEELREQLAEKDAEIKRLQSRIEYLDKRDARTLKDYADLQEQLTAKDAEIKYLRGYSMDMMENCNQLRTRCWKAEGELVNWQTKAIEERAKFNARDVDLCPVPSDVDVLPEDANCECQLVLSKCPNKKWFLDQAAKELGLYGDD